MSAIVPAVDNDVLSRNPVNAASSADEISAEVTVLPRVSAHARGGDPLGSPPPTVTGLGSGIAIPYPATDSPLVATVPIESERGFLKVTSTPEQIAEARHAKKNASIVATDAHLNSACVNDGTGGFRITQSVADVLAYGDAREARVRRKIAEGQTTVNLFIVHLPKTLCAEIEDFYPRLNPAGTQRLDAITGEPMSRSRWVARDHDEAMRYFTDAVAFLGENVIPGRQAAIHGWATNFEETTPHIQLMADPFARDSKAPSTKPDALRTEQNQAYGSHREVCDRDGNQMGGKAKLRSYQAAMRAHMIARGWDVEPTPGPRRTGQPKSEYQATQDEKADAIRIHEAAIDIVVDALEDQYMDEYERRLEMEEEREAHYGELGVKYMELQRKQQQVEDVLRLERQRLAAERTEEAVEHQRAMESLRVQTDIARNRERSADHRERAVEVLELQLRRRLAVTRDLHAAAQELGRQTLELAKANGVGVRAPNAADLKRARAAHDNLLAQLREVSAADQGGPGGPDLER